MLKLREELISAEEERLMGKKEYSIDELDKMLEDAVAEANHAEKNTLSYFLIGQLQCF